MFDKFFNKVDEKLKKTKEYLKSEEFQDKVNTFKDDAKKFAGEVETMGKNIVNDFSKNKNSSEDTKSDKEEATANETTQETNTVQKEEPKTTVDLESKETIVEESIEKPENEELLVADSDLPLPVKKSLISAGYSSITNIKKMTDEEILAIKGVGKASLDKIKNAKRGS